MSNDSPSFLVLKAIPYSIAASSCHFGQKGKVCRFLGIRASLKQDNTPPSPDASDRSPEAKLWRATTGSACVCMKGHPVLRAEAELFKNQNDLCSGPPDYQKP